MCNHHKVALKLILRFHLSGHRFPLLHLTLPPNFNLLALDCVPKKMRMLVRKQIKAAKIIFPLCILRPFRTVSESGLAQDCHTLNSGT